MKKIIYLIIGCILGVGSVMLIQSAIPIKIKEILIRKNILKSDVLKNKIVMSNYYNFSMVPYEINSKGGKSTARYGGIENLNGNLIFIDGDGKYFKFLNSHFEYVGNISIKNNKNDFVNDYQSEFLGVYFGIKDILISTRGRKRIYISSTEFDKEKKCYFLSVFANDFESIDATFVKKSWDKLYSTKPCLPQHSGGKFLGQSAGGRLVIDDANQNLYISTGDFYFDGVNEKNILQRSDSDYGKIIRIPAYYSNAKVKEVARGLRNPQGLFFMNNWLYSTEHGPQGGDELNFIKLKLAMDKGVDLGWPNATFGVNYGAKEWPLDKLNSNHVQKKNQLPMYSWTPSIGVSNLIVVKQSKNLIRWSGAMLVSSLKDMALYIIKFNNEKVYAIERVEVGIRVRDIVQIDDEFYLLEDKDVPVIWKMSLQP